VSQENKGLTQHMPQPLGMANARIQQASMSIYVLAFDKLAWYCKSNLVIFKKSIYEIEHDGNFTGRNAPLIVIGAMGVIMRDSIACPG
jgi:RecA-family ATPase